MAWSWLYDSGAPYVNSFLAHFKWVSAHMYTIIPWREKRFIRFGIFKVWNACDPGGVYYLDLHKKLHPVTCALPYYTQRGLQLTVKPDYESYRPNSNLSGMNAYMWTMFQILSFVNGERTSVAALSFLCVTWDLRMLPPKFELNQPSTVESGSW